MTFTSGARLRDFRLIVGARAASYVGDEAAVIALTLMLAHNGPWAVAGLLLAGFGPLIVMAPVAGLLADRMDSRTLLVGIGLLQAGLCLALAYTSALPIVVGLVALLSAGQAITGATWSALLPGVVGMENLARAIGISQAATNAAMIFAPALGGALAGAGGARLVLLINVATYLLLAAGAGLVRHRRRVVHEPGAAPRALEGFRVLRADRTLLLMVGMFFLFILLGAMANVVNVFLIRDTLDAGPAWYGAESSTVGAAMLAGSLWAGRLSGQRRLVRASVVGMAAMAVSAVGYATAPTIAWVFPWAVICGAGNATVNVAANTVVALRVAAAVRGRVSAAIGGLMSTGIVIATVLGGLAGSAFTPREVFAIAGIVGLAVPLTVAPALLRSVRTDLSEAPREPVLAAA
jgi:MFS family permease